jgi:hypothetical protein
MPIRCRHPWSSACNAVFAISPACCGRSIRRCNPPTRQSDRQRHFARHRWFSGATGYHRHEYEWWCRWLFEAVAPRRPEGKRCAVARRRAAPARWSKHDVSTPAIPFVFIGIEIKHELTALVPVIMLFDQDGVAKLSRSYDPLTASGSDQWRRTCIARPIAGYWR